MEAGHAAIASFDFDRLRAPPRQRRVGRIDSAVSREAGHAETDFSATLLAMAGHDLRQPLQLITSAHDVLAPTLDAEEQQQELMRAREATGQLAGMLGQLVEALQLRERSDDDLHVLVPLRPVLEELAAEFAEMARLKGVTFVVAAAGGTAISHPVLLTGMLRNLIRNAIDYTPPGGGVFVRSRRCGPELRIEVRDTGVGIRAGALSMIFRAFQRADESRADGLGLGLFIVKHAADLLGHHVEVRSAEGRGSCFTILATQRANAGDSLSGYRLWTVRQRPSCIAVGPFQRQVLICAATASRKYAHSARSGGDADGLRKLL
jgi:two-component system phosphate regulon sensor histidine kinase PhoR